MSFTSYLARFEEQWALWTYEDGHTMKRARGYRRSLERWFDAGLGVDALCEAVDMAAGADVPDRRVWRYFSDICVAMILEAGDEE